MAINYTPCSQLRTIPENKFLLQKETIISNCDVCSKKVFISCNKCMLLDKLFSRYYSANIPVNYWNKSIERDFCGDKQLLSLYESITIDTKTFFSNGTSIFLKGMHGVGKTFISSMILKKIVEKGYNGLYSTLSDIVNVAVYGNYKDKFDALRELKMIDFLVIDEFDPRFFSSDASAELFGRILESLIRIRFQNQMPTILVTNNPDPTKALGDSLGASISSLISGHCKEIFIVGKDFRKTDGAICKK